MNEDVLEERLAAILFMYSRCRGYMTIVDAVNEMVAGRHLEELRSGELAASVMGSIGCEAVALVAEDPELRRRAEELIDSPATRQHVLEIRKRKAQAIQDAQASKMSRRRRAP